MKKYLSKSGNDYIFINDEFEELVGLNTTIGIENDGVKSGGAF